MHQLGLLSSLLSDVDSDQVVALLPQLEPLLQRVLGGGCNSRVVLNCGGMMLSTLMNGLTSYQQPIANWRAGILKGSGVESWIDKEGHGCDPVG